VASGRFIALEGLDGAGTSTQADALAAVLRQRGSTVLQTREPSDGSIGRQTRDHLRADRDPPADPRVTALLFAADRLEHVQCEVAPALQRGETVICDRYVMSSWVYQALDCDPAWIRQINAQAPWPDVTVFLDVDVDVAVARVRSRAGVAEIYDREAVQRRLAAAYRALVDEALPGVVVVGGDAPIATVTERILAALSPR
jgi:dTMP kinase